LSNIDYDGEIFFVGVYIRPSLVVFYSDYEELNLNPFCGNMVIYFTNLIFTWWCAVWVRDLSGGEARIHFYPIKTLISSSFLPFPFSYYIIYLYVVVLNAQNDISFEIPGHVLDI